MLINLAAVLFSKSTLFLSDTYPNIQVAAQAKVRCLFVQLCSARPTNYLPFKHFSYYIPPRLADCLKPQGSDLELSFRQLCSSHEALSAGCRNFLCKLTIDLILISLPRLELLKLLRISIPFLSCRGLEVFTAVLFNPELSIWRPPKMQSIGFAFTILRAFGPLHFSLHLVSYSSFVQLTRISLCLHLVISHRRDKIHQAFVSLLKVQPPIFF